MTVHYKMRFKKYSTQFLYNNFQNISYFQIINVFNPHQHMDIQFVEQEHRDNIFKIMELCNCDMAEAYQLYQNNACNVENAVQAKFNGLEGRSTVPPAYQETYSKPISYENNSNLATHHFGYDMGQEDEYSKYKTFKRNGMNFNGRYEVRRDNSGITKSVFSFFTSSQNTFKKNLQTYIGRKTNLSLQNGSLSQALQSVSKQKFPLIVHVLDFGSKQPTVINNIKRIYSDEFLVQMMSEQFKNYGVDVRDYQLEHFLSLFIDLKVDANSLLVFRVNVVDQVMLITKIPFLSTKPQQIKKKLKQVKSNCINLQMEELHLEKRYQAEQNGDFEYKKPMSLNEKRKLQEDREIRRKQEEEFFAAMQPKQQQQKPSTTGTYGQSSSKTQAPIVKIDTKAEEKEKRRKVRESLRVYETDGQGMLAIKLRLPSSELMKLYVHSKEPAQYLYDYVFSREGDLGFEDDASRRVFDIIQPYERLNLSQRKNEQLGKIFGEETMLTLVVNEKTE